MSISYIPLGFFIKLFTGLDDLAITIPLVEGLGFEKKFSRKVVFASGILLAAFIAVIFAFFFSTAIKAFQYHEEITALLLFTLATVIYFRLLDKHTEKHVKRSARRIKDYSENNRLLKIFAVSFTAFLISSSDDVIAYIPLFLGGVTNTVYASIGVFFAVVLEIGMAIYFAEKIEKFEYKTEVTSLILVIIGILVLNGVL